MTLLKETKQAAGIDFIKEASSPYDHIGGNQFSIADAYLFTVPGRRPAMQ